MKLCTGTGIIRHAQVIHNRTMCPMCVLERGKAELYKEIEKLNAEATGLYRRIENLKAEGEPV